MITRVVRYAYACALCAPVCFNLALAQSAQTPPGASSDDSLNEIVVVANRAPEPLSKIGNSITVLTEAAIKASQQIVVSDLLAQTPGLTVARDGGVGQLTTVFIRGADSDETVVVIDGVQMNDPSAPAGEFNFANLLTSDISRIEILRGAQSTLYGSQAMGGVINIVTGEPAGPFGGGVNAEGGSHDTGYATANVGGKDDALMWRLSGNWYGTSGIPAFDEKLGGTRLDASQIGGGSGQVRYDITPDLQFDLRGYYTQARTDFDGFDTPTGNFGDDNEYEKSSQFLGYAGLTLRSADRTFTNRVAFQYTDTDTRLFDPNAPANYGSPSIETYYGVGRNEREEYQGTWAITPRIQAVFGAQHERSTIDTYSGEFQPAAPPVENFATIDSGYAQVQAEVAAGLTLTAGERYDRHNVYGGHSTGALAAAWVLNGGETILRSSFSQGFKAPSLYQLYSSYGNLALRPEAAESWDAGLEQHAWDGRLVLSAAYFQRYSRDLIEFFDCTTPNPLCVTEPFGYYANIARAAAHGVELQGAVKPNSQLTLAANYTLTDTEDKSPGSPTYGQELIRRPKNTANASVTYRWSSPLRTSLAARYAGPSFDDDFASPTGQIQLGGYVLVDVKISYTLMDHLELYGRVDNAAGKHYETVYQYGTYGRVGYAGVRATF
ncbi:MAG TPA: TonB-dependent receptor [Steroidobacteraceae bacterium]|nr:TonB-dependent receptor [Steroidobacteraceae bacterium]